MIIPDNKRKLSTIIISRMKDGESKEIEAKPEADMRGEEELDAIAMDLMDAINSKSVMGIKDALKAFFYQCDAMPHQEGEHEEEDDKE
jgi:hypothetical protein